MAASQGSRPVDTSPSYVPSFPFYDAEPYWPKGGYGHHGGSGDDSGSAATTDFYVFVESFDTPAPGLNIGESEEDIQNLEYEPMTVEITIDETTTVCCYHYKNCPVGAKIYGPSANNLPALYYSDQLQPPMLDSDPLNMNFRPLYCPRPLDGSYIVGTLESGSGSIPPST